MTKKVSVIVVNYNCVDDVIELIKSLENQKYDNYELIVVDNFSTDRSIEILPIFHKKHIIFYFGENNSIPSGTSQA